MALTECNLHLLTIKHAEGGQLLEHNITRNCQLQLNETVALALILSMLLRNIGVTDIAILAEDFTEMERGGACTQILHHKAGVANIGALSLGSFRTIEDTAMARDN